MAINVIDAIEYFDASSVSSISTPYEITAWDDRILIVTSPESRATQATSVTYNWVALTKATEVYNGNYGSVVYYLVNPPVWTHTLTANFSATVTFHLMHIIYATGVDQTTPLWATNTKTGSAQTKSISVTTTQANSLLIDTLWANWGVHSVSWWQTYISNWWWNRATAYKILTAAAWSETVSWTSTTFAAYWYVVAEFKEAVTINNWNFFNFF